MQTDIDERKRAEEALRESERELRQLIDNVPGMIAVADSTGRVEYANKRHLDFTGATIEELRESGGLHTFHPDDQEMIKDEWLRRSAVGQPLDLDCRRRRFDGVYRWVHIRVDPLREDQ